MARLGVNPVIALFAGLHRCDHRLHHFPPGQQTEDQRIHRHTGDVRRGARADLPDFQGSNIFVRSKGFSSSGRVTLAWCLFRHHYAHSCRPGIDFSEPHGARSPDVRAIGGNERAATLARGPREPGADYRLRSHEHPCSICRIIASGMLGSAEMVAGTGLELDVLAAVIIGGASLKGGKGTIIGSIIGAAIMGVLRNGFILVGFHTKLR